MYSKAHRFFKVDDHKFEYRRFLGSDDEKLSGRPILAKETI